MSRLRHSNDATYGWISFECLLGACLEEAKTSKNAIKHIREIQVIDSLEHRRIILMNNIISQTF